MSKCLLCQDILIQFLAVGNDDKDVDLFLFTLGERMCVKVFQDQRLSTPVVSSSHSLFPDDLFLDNLFLVLDNLFMEGLFPGGLFLVPGNLFLDNLFLDDL